MQHNPLIHAIDNGFGTPEEIPPFSDIKPEHYLPAFEFGARKVRERLAAIESLQTAPNFENVILALEQSSEPIDHIRNIFFNLFSAETSDELQKIAGPISQMSAALSLEMSLNEKIFAHVKHVYEHRAHLDQEQQMLTEKTYLSFARNGALLSPKQKEQLKAIDQELATLSPQFSENVLKATNAFQLFLSPEECPGLPAHFVESATADATAKGQPGKLLITLQAPSYIPFMTFCENRALREKVSLAFASRSYKGEFDNEANVLRTVELRIQRAQLLGYKTHAHYVLEERMAATPEKVFEFLESLLTPSKKAAEKDLADLNAFAKQHGYPTPVESWDVHFLSEKLKKEKFEIDEELLRPYFPLNHVLNGMFEHARKLYQLDFKERTDIPKYHPEVQTFEVIDKNTHEHVGHLSLDFFPRETKRGGAWMTTYREQGLWLGQVRRPLVSLVCNFTRPTASKPALLSYDEVRTLFHEFGHGLHGLLSKCRYRSLAGTSVYWDFVELPSQIMENWTKEKEGLSLIARHYETGGMLPDELVQKIKKAETFQAGWMSARQLSFALMDMAWHTLEALPKGTTVGDFESKATERTRFFPVRPGTNSSVSFSHIFSGGYSAGYYSYKWAEVLDADAFELFLEKGLFDPSTAKAFKENILEKGGTEHPMELYKRFRGREPDPQALLRRDGLSTGQA